MSYNIPVRDIGFNIVAHIRANVDLGDVPLVIHDNLSVKSKGVIINIKQGEGFGDQYQVSVKLPFTIYVKSNSYEESEEIINNIYEAPLWGYGITLPKFVFDSGKEVLPRLVDSINPINTPADFKLSLSGAQDTKFKAFTANIFLSRS